MTELPDEKSPEIDHNFVIAAIPLILGIIYGGAIGGAIGGVTAVLVHKYISRKPTSLKNYLIGLGVMVLGALAYFVIAGGLYVMAYGID